MMGTEDENRALARRRRINRLKKEIIIFVLLLIIIPTILSIVFGISLHLKKVENRELISRIEALESELNAERGESLIYEPVAIVNSSREDNDLTADASLNQVMEADNSETAEGDGRKHVYLTFDDGPSSNTDRILEILDEYDAKATFFVVGKQALIYDGELEKIVEAGHSLGMHSYSHVYRDIYESVDSFANDLHSLQDLIYNQTGTWVRISRFPGGSSNNASKVEMRDIIDYLDAQKITYYDWNVSSGDATSGYQSSETIAQNVLAGVAKFNDSVVLMHDADAKKSTVEALPIILEELKKMDVDVVPITDDTVAVQHIKSKNTEE